MKFNENIKKGLLRLILAGSLFAGGVTLSEKTGLTKAFVKYNDTLRYIYYNASQKWPWLVWAHYGSPYTETKEGREARLTRYRVGSDVGIGLISSLAGFCVIDAVRERKFRKKFEEK